MIVPTKTYTGDRVVKLGGNTIIRPNSVYALWVFFIFGEKL